MLEIEGLSDLTDLRRLSITKTRITKITGLEKLTKLEFLDLTRNHITKVEGLGNLTSLRVLDLTFNDITYLEGVYNLVKLEKLYIDDEVEVDDEAVDLLPKNCEIIKYQASPGDFYFPKNWSGLYTK